MAEDIQRESAFPFDFGGQQVPAQVGTALKWAAVVLAIILVFVFISFAKSVYTDWLWFDHLGLRSVFTTILWTRIGLFFAGAAVLAAVLTPSLLVAARLSAGEVQLPLPPEVVEVFYRVIRWVSVAVVAVLSAIFGAILASGWDVFLRLANSVPFEQNDPVYDRDIAFYVFNMPALTFVQGWLLGAAIVITLATAALYYVRFSLRGVGFHLGTGIKNHASVAGAVIMFVIAWGHWLDRWDLVLSPQGAVVGAAYADINARMPALLVLAIIAVASGVLMLVNIRLSGLRLVVGAAALWMVMAIALGSVWPALMQQITVNPNELEKERPYIIENIEATRAGFGLTHIEESFYSGETPLDEDLILDNLQTINNIRLWDYRPLSSVYRQIQLIRPYYDFKDADVDRYLINGETRQVLLAAREVAPEKLAPQSQTWTNTTLVYTHGIGVAMSPVTEFTPEGRPEFFAKDIPSDGVIPIQVEGSTDTPDILVENPRIYYGENTLGHVVVNSETEELDYSTESSGNVNTRYSGDGGVITSSLLRRAAFAWQLTDVNLLISGQINEDSRIHYRREIQERISTVAPFLTLDEDPYIVATNEGFFWLQDAYTVTDRFPYSDPIDGSFNYIRNSVKITVDAFNGTMRFYIWDESDPIIAAYRDIFPELFTPSDQMPQSLRDHVRYPVDFFRIQAEKYIRYHMQEPRNFYNNEDLWAVADEKFGQGSVLQPVEPYYVIMKLPDEEKEEFVLLLPYTPNERQNLIGWLAARSDGENYGKLVAFNFPKDRQIDGPAQVEARIDNDPEISAWFTLRCTEGSTCIRGNLLVIPIGQSLLYAEPVYIEAEGVNFPELKRVILATGDKVVMGESLDDALGTIVGGAITSRLRTTPGTDGESAGLSLETAGALLDELTDITQAMDGLKDELTQIEEAVQRLKELLGGE